jgi:hypothetical protein
LKYKEVRIKRNSSSRIGSASKESLVFFEPIIKILNDSKILFYCGINGNREWYIKDGDDFFLYDLSIPSLSLIIEYHGEGFHPNPDWDTVRWSQWRQAFSKKTADECRSYDIRKKQVAEKNGWTVIEVFSSAAETRSLEIYNDIQSKLLLMAN